MVADRHVNEGRERLLVDAPVSAILRQAGRAVALGEVVLLEE
jgi:hypothetical protein